MQTPRIPRCRSHLSVDRAPVERPVSMLRVKDQSEVASQVDDYLRSGGTVDVIDFGVGSLDFSGPHPAKKPEFSIKKPGEVKRGRAR